MTEALRFKGEYESSNPAASHTNPRTSDLTVGAVRPGTLHQMLVRGMPISLGKHSSVIRACTVLLHALLQLLTPHTISSVTTSVGFSGPVSLSQ